MITRRQNVENRTETRKSKAIQNVVRDGVNSNGRTLESNRPEAVAQRRLIKLSAECKTKKTTTENSIEKNNGILQPILIDNKEWTPKALGEELRKTGLWNHGWQTLIDQWHGNTKIRALYKNIEELRSDLLSYEDAPEDKVRDSVYAMTKTIAERYQNLKCMEFAETLQGKLSGEGIPYTSKALARSGKFPRAGIYLGESGHPTDGLAIGYSTHYYTIVNCEQGKMVFDNHHPDGIPLVHYETQHLVKTDDDDPTSTIMPLTHALGAGVYKSIEMKPTATMTASSMLAAPSKAKANAKPTRDWAAMKAAGKNAMKDKEKGQDGSS